METERTVEGEAGELRSLLHTALQMGIESREAAEEGMIWHCSAQITLLGKDEEGMPVSLSLTEQFPLSIPFTETLFERIRPAAQPSVSMDGGRVKVTIPLRLEGLAADTQSISYVGSILPTAGELPSSEDSITLCYPQAGETAWDIAKRYRISQGMLASVNSLPEEGLPTVLLIPR